MFTSALRNFLTFFLSKKLLKKKEKLVKYSKQILTLFFCNNFFFFRWKKNLMRVKLPSWLRENPKVRFILIRSPVFRRLRHYFPKFRRGNGGGGRKKQHERKVQGKKVSPLGVIQKLFLSFFFLVSGYRKKKSHNVIKVI